MTSPWFVVACVLALSLGGTAHADKKKPPVAEPAAAPAEEPADPAADPAAEAPPEMPAHLVGPQHVDLGHGATIDLPAGMILFEQTVAKELMRKGGNSSESVIAAIISQDTETTWLIVIEADDVGYVSDSDAEDLDADTMLEQFKAGTIEQNKQRTALGFPELFIDGWSEKPRYERLKRHLVWGINGHDTDGKVVNFFTRFLGRHGYLSVNVIDDPAKIEASKVTALAVLTAVTFKVGSRYEDYVEGDKESGLGLRALVLGGAGVAVAKKGGILVAILLFLKKGFVFVIAAIGGLFKWLFGRRKKADAPPADPAPSDPEPPPAV